MFMMMFTFYFHRNVDLLYNCMFMSVMIGRHSNFNVSAEKKMEKILELQKIVNKKLRRRKNW